MSSFLHRSHLRLFLISRAPLWTLAQALTMPEAIYGGRPMTFLRCFFEALKFEAAGKIAVLSKPSVRHPA
jgi:hypothetical protein